MIHYNFVLGKEEDEGCLELLRGFPHPLSVSGDVEVYFICTDDMECLDRIVPMLRRTRTERSVYIVNELQHGWFYWNHVFEDREKARAFLERYQDR